MGFGCHDDGGTHHGARTTTDQGRSGRYPATHSPANGPTLTDALDRWYTSLAAGESVRSPRTIAAYRYGTDKLVDRNALRSLTLGVGYIVAGVAIAFLLVALAPLLAAYIHSFIRAQTTNH
jgi:hypothetical protein